MKTAAKLQHPAHDIEQLSFLTLDSALVERTVTTAAANTIAVRVVHKIPRQQFDKVFKFLDNCAALMDNAIMVAATAIYNALRNGLMKYGNKAKRSISSTKSKAI